jgi:FKBP-type peptidyl-prolyl cis-trans isomerase
MRASTLLLLVLSLLPLTSVNAQREKLPLEDLLIVEKQWPQAKKTNTGMRYIIQREGTGESPKPGDSVSVLFVGKLIDGQVFDQTQDASGPFTFRLSRMEVIDGWDQILQLMKRGEKRLVIIPPELAYGSRGQPPKIPRNATLVFEIDLLDFKRD